MRRGLAGLVLALLALAAPARAEWPDRPLQLLVSYPPGGSTDILARALAEALGQELRQPVAVINRDGGAGSVGAAALAQARPDGYTLGFTSATAVGLQPLLNPGLPYRLGAFSPICLTWDLQFALAVAPNSPFHSLAELVEEARLAPGRFSFGVNGTGSGAHLAMAELLGLAGMNLLHVPYRGDALVVAPLLAGEVSVGVMGASLAEARGLRMLGLFARERSAYFPALPTMAEQGFAAAQSALGGLFAPAGLDGAVWQRLERACAAAVRSEGHRRALANLKEPLRYEDSARFAATIEADVNDKRRLLETLGIR